MKNLKKKSKINFSIKVLAISDNSDFSFFLFFCLGGVPQIFFRHFSSSFTLMSAHTNFHDPRTETETFPGGGGGGVGVGGWRN